MDALFLGRSAYDKNSTSKFRISRNNLAVEIRVNFYGSFGRYENISGMESERENEQYKYETAF